MRLQKGTDFQVSLAHQLNEHFTHLPLKVNRMTVCLTVPFKTFCVPRFAQFSVSPHGVSGVSWECWCLACHVIREEMAWQGVKVLTVEFCFLVPLFRTICGSGGLEHVSHVT